MKFAGDLDLGVFFSTNGFLVNTLIQKKLKDLNIEINDKDFWNNPIRAQKVSIEASTIEKLISSLENLETNLSDIKELIEITGEDNLNENDFLDEINNFEEMIEEIAKLNPNHEKLKRPPYGRPGLAGYVLTVHLRVSLHVILSSACRPAKKVSRPN